MGVVHAVGGLAGLVTCKNLGHRHGLIKTDADRQKASLSEMKKDPLFKELEEKMLVGKKLSQR